MNSNEIERHLIDCFDETEWHLSLWLPRVTREVVGFPPGASDKEVQECLVRLIQSGTLETGAVEGSEFVPTPFQLTAMGRCPDLYVRAAAVPATHSR